MNMTKIYCLFSDTLGFIYHSFGNLGSLIFNNSPSIVVESLNQTNQELKSQPKNKEEENLKCVKQRCVLHKVREKKNYLSRCNSDIYLFKGENKWLNGFGHIWSFYLFFYFSSLHQLSKMLMLWMTTFAHIWSFPQRFILYIFYKKKLRCRVQLTTGTFIDFSFTPFYKAALSNQFF